MAKIGLSSPWVIFYREVNELFKYDPEVHVIFDEDKTQLRLYVDNGEKADALAKLLPTEKEFGTVTLSISVIPANGLKEATGNLFEVALNGNGALSYVKQVNGVWYPTLSFVVFRKKVVQYFTDNLGDINGYTSTLYQDVAKDVFGEWNGVYYCTDTEDIVYDELGSPLGEWP